MSVPSASSPPKEEFTTPPRKQTPQPAISDVTSSKRLPTSRMAPNTTDDLDIKTRRSISVSTALPLAQSSPKL
ncbi:hypothetical protein HK097_005821, partial [Rhizophlyctis rosea]